MSLSAPTGSAVSARCRCRWSGPPCSSAAHRPAV